MAETLADQLHRLCCAETEGKFFDCVTDNIDTIITALRSHDKQVKALKNVQRLISEAAMTGFNCKDGDWAERLFESQQMTSRALRDAVSSQKDSGK